MLSLILTMADPFSTLAVERIATGYLFTEGAVYTKKGTVLFSDIPANKIYEWKGEGKVELAYEPSLNANGNTIDAKGNVYSCEHSGRAVVMRDEKGTRKVLADSFLGKKLNSPNDLVIAKNGDIYFTDPPYGISPAQAEQGANAIYRIDKKGAIYRLDSDFDRPNGIGISPDGKVLYVSDTARKHIRAFDITDMGVMNGRTFAKIETTGPNNPDGLRVDKKGNVYCTSGNGVHVFDAKGVKLGVIPVPESATNCAFGGKDGKTLFITAGKSLYRVTVPYEGIRPGF